MKTLRERNRKLGPFGSVCGTNIYSECIENRLFRSNLAWPLEVKQGDYCLLRHCEVGTVFALWQAASDGGRKLVPKAWGGRFPFQVRVTLVTPAIDEVPKRAVNDFILNPTTGRYDNVIEGDSADGLIQAVRGLAQLSEA